MGQDRSDGAGCGCGRASWRDGTASIAFDLPRSRVTASATVRARRCGGCGSVDVDPTVLARCRLAVGCRLADAGVHTGEAFRHLRKALGLRAAELARLLGVTPETISHWETGRAEPNRCAYVALAAMAHEALDGRHTTRDRLDVRALGRGHPRKLAIEVL